MVRPSLNDAVHWVSLGSADGSYPPACTAADVTWVHPDEPGTGDHIVSLLVKKPWSIDFHQGVLFHEGFDLTHDDAESSGLMCGDRDYPPGTWHWGQ
jgi:hypothetical protein